jgi:hypothetical protein
MAMETDKKPKEIQVANLNNLMTSEALNLYVSQNEEDTETALSIQEVSEQYCLTRIKSWKFMFIVESKWMKSHLIFF